MLGTGRRGSAADMKLFQHKDFEQAVIRAEDHFKKLGLRAAFIEKDYYVTEALRTLAAAAPHKIIFKGGTSLAKGWNLIQRFSEDIDIFLDPRAFDPALNKRAIDRELKTLRDAVTTHPGLTFVQEESKTIGGFGRGDRFAYTPIFGGPGAPANRVLLEAGTASGRTHKRRHAALLHRTVSRGNKGLARRRRRGPVHDAAASFSANFCREDVRNSRQSTASQTRQHTSRHVCKALL